MPPPGSQDCTCSQLLLASTSPTAGVKTITFILRKNNRVRETARIVHAEGKAPIEEERGRCKPSMRRAVRDRFCDDWKYGWYYADREANLQFFCRLTSRSSAT